MYRFLLLLLLLGLSLDAAPKNLPNQPLAQPEKRVRQAEVRLEQAPDDPQALFQAAVALQQLQQFDRAADYYRRLIRLRPQWPEPRNNLAIILLRKGDHDGAIDLLISSLQTHPAYETAWRNLGNLYKGLASEAYRRALSEEQNGRSVLDGIRLEPLTYLTRPDEPAPTATIAQAPVTRTPEPLPTSAPAPAPKPAPETPPKPAVATAPDAPRPPPGAKAPPATKTPLRNNIQDVTQRIQQIRQAVLDWTDAWSRKDLPGYIQAYAEDYRDGKPSHQAWVDWRRQRIQRPGDIRVEVSNLRVRRQSERQARVDFIQSYQSPRYRDRVVKRLDLAKIKGSWKIVREKTLRVLQSP